MQISNWCSDLCCGEVLAIGTEKISGEGKYLVRGGEEQRERKGEKYSEKENIWSNDMPYEYGITWRGGEGGSLMSCHVIEKAGKEEKYLKRENLFRAASDSSDKFHVWYHKRFNNGFGMTIYVSMLHCCNMIKSLIPTFHWWAVNLVTVPKMLAKHW